MHKSLIHAISGGSGFVYHLISSCWFVSYRIPSCFNVLRLPLRSTAISLGVNVTSSCKEQMIMFAAAKWKEELLKYELTCITWVISLRTETGRIQQAVIRKHVYFRQFHFYTLNVFPSRHKISWSTSLSFICASEGLYKKDDSCIKKKCVSIKHKCVLKLMFIKGSLRTLHVVYMWLIENSFYRLLEVKIEIQIYKLYQRCTI